MEINEKVLNIENQQKNKNKIQCDLIVYIGCRKFDSSNCVRSRSILREKNAVFRLLAKIK